MLETFLILLAGGIMLAAAIPDPKTVTLHWLRLAGILALVMAGLAVIFMRRQAEPLGIGPWLTWSLMSAAVLGQLASAQIPLLVAGRLCALGAFVLSVVSAAIQQPFFPQPVAPWPTHYPGVELFLSWTGIASMSGIVLMEMLLGHAYLTASRMTMRPFERLSRSMIVTVGLRALCGVGLPLMIQAKWPVMKLWGIYGLYIGTRWFVGLLVPAVFVFMAHDCIKRRSTQSATGILYVAGVLIFIGEIIALYLVRETGLPF